MPKMIHLPLCYAAPISYYYYLINYDCQIEVHANYKKQTYANRCYIATSNGVENLTIPVQKPQNKTIIKDIKILNDTNWQTNHYRALYSAYSSSPYFEYFSDRIQNIYSTNFDFLLDFNLRLQELILSLLQFNEIKVSLSEEYAINPSNDFREEFSAKKSFTHIENIIRNPYYQVFEHKYGFISNLSIFDLIFNLGLESRIYLLK